MPLYFAYGSNLSTEQISERCPSARFISAGWLPGYRLDFTRRSSLWEGGVADVVVSAKDDVWGVVYTISEEDFAELDKHEGYPDCYNRFEATIFTLDGMLERIWVYTVKEKEPFVAPSKAYMNVLKAAAKEHQFPSDYRKMLDAVKTQ